jgi:hypothetical protein
MPVSMQIAIALLVAILVGLILLTAFLIYVFFRWRGDLSRSRYFGRHEDYLRYRAEYETPLSRIIASAESRNGFWAAREMIIIPILEQIEEGQPIYWDQVDESINKLVETTREESRPAERSRFGGVNSLSIIRSYFRNFCNIPPFCLPTDEVRTRSP